MMLKNITITLGCLLIWGFVGGFDWVNDTIECLQFNRDLLNQVKVAENLFNNLSNELVTKELVIDNYKKEILDWTIKYNNIKEQLDLTKHSLNMANEALNSITSDVINDSSDYE